MPAPPASPSLPALSPGSCPAFPSSAEAPKWRRRAVSREPRAGQVTEGRGGAGPAHERARQRARARGSHLPGGAFSRPPRCPRRRPGVAGVCHLACPQVATSDARQRGHSILPGWPCAAGGRWHSAALRFGVCPCFWAALLVAEMQRSRRGAELAQGQPPGRWRISGEELVRGAAGRIRWLDPVTQPRSGGTWWWSFRPVSWRARQDHRQPCQQGQTPSEALHSASLGMQTVGARREPQRRMPGPGPGRRPPTEGGE